MSCETIYKCDYCNANVSPYVGKQWRATLFTVGPSMDDIHACSKEHMGVALAKAFGIGIDSKCLELLANATAEIINEKGKRSEAEIDARLLRERLSDLEARTPANQCTDAERMQFEITIEQKNKRIAELERRQEAEAVFHAFGPTIIKQAVVEALERLRKRLMPTDLSEHYNINTQTIQEAFDAETTFLEAPTPVRGHVHGLGSCAHCDTKDFTEPHDGCLDCNGSGWSGGNVRNGACDVPRKAAP